jgi:hypothetical protein
MIRRDSQSHVGVSSLQLDDTAHVRTNQIVGQEDIAGSGGGQHLSFGHRGALVFADTPLQFDFDHLTDLMRLAVRPEPFRPACDSDHLIDILFQELAKDDQRGSDDLAGVFDLVSYVHNDRQLL